MLLVSSHTRVLTSRNVSNGLVVIGYSVCGDHFHYADRTRLPFLQIAHSHTNTRAGIWNGWQCIHVECNAPNVLKKKERWMNEATRSKNRRKKVTTNERASEWKKHMNMNMKAIIYRKFFSSSCFCFNSICWFEVFDYTLGKCVCCML